MPTLKIKTPTGRAIMLRGKVVGRELDIYMVIIHAKSVAISRLKYII